MRRNISYENRVCQRKGCKKIIKNPLPSQKYCSEKCVNEVLREREYKRRRTAKFRWYNKEYARKQHNPDYVMKPYKGGK